MHGLNIAAHLKHPMKHLHKISSLALDTKLVASANLLIAKQYMWIETIKYSQVHYYICELRHTQLSTRIPLCMWTQTYSTIHRNNNLVDEDIIIHKYTTASLYVETYSTIHRYKSIKFVHKNILNYTQQQSFCGLKYSQLSTSTHLQI